MKIINVHNHIAFRFSGDSKDLSSFIKESRAAGVTTAGITLNTTLEEISDEVLKFKEKRNQDPYFKWNLYMMETLESKKTPLELFPFLYLPPELSLAKASMNKYEEMFKDRKFGYKIHSQGIKENIQNLKGIQSLRPLIIHSSVDYSTPKDILNSFSDYKGNVALAHFAKFDIDVLKQIKNLKNFFIDSSISIFMLESLKSKSNRVYLSKELLDSNSPEDLYRRVAKICGEDKILFATDYPVSETLGKGYKKEVEILSRLPKSQREKISYKNAIRFLN
jgi:predicted TIM-barrel fold metal-dependent hydrolase